MNQEYQLLYHEMLQDVERCMGLDLPGTEKMESGFWIAHKYWERLQGAIRQKGFCNEQEEIEFFREVKPHFTCYMEYFILLCESVQFVPVQKDTEREFWEHEEKRLDRFCAKHETFVNYYESGERHGDPLYFLRENNNQAKPVRPKLAFDNDATLTTSHDQVLRSYLANKKYNAYVKEKLELLKKNEPLNNAGNVLKG